MHYFITSQENHTPSAIEIAQMQRVHLFESFGQEAKIMTYRIKLPIVMARNDCRLCCGKIVCIPQIITINTVLWSSRLLR